MDLQAALLKETGGANKSKMAEAGLYSFNAHRLRYGRSCREGDSSCSFEPMQSIHFHLRRPTFNRLLSMRPTGRPWIDRDSSREGNRLLGNSTWDANYNVVKNLQGRYTDHALVPQSSRAETFVLFKLPILALQSLYARYLNLPSSDISPSAYIAHFSGDMRRGLCHIVQRFRWDCIARD